MQKIERALEKLGKSKFRSSFRLTKKEKAYIEQKGMDIIRQHAADFVRMAVTVPVALRVVTVPDCPFSTVRESRNDDYKGYHELATQSDMDKF